MDKMIENNNLNHIINITERKSIVITGVKKIETFSQEEFILDTSLGLILLKGANLEIIKLDTLAGNVSIKGKIDYLEYTSENESNKESSFLTKLFR